MKELRARSKAYQRGVDLGVDYVWFVDGDCMVCKQPIEGELYQVGKWNIKTLLHHESDLLYVDLGQGGM